MPESSSNRPVTVTAEERTRPAILQLARACIAMARHLAGSSPTKTLPTTAIPEAARQERADD